MFGISAKTERTDKLTGGWGLAFVSAQEFKTRMCCLIAFTDGSLNHIYTERGLLEVRVEISLNNGKDRCVLLGKVQPGAGGGTVGSRCFGLLVGPQPVSGIHHCTPRDGGS